MLKSYRMFDVLPNYCLFSMFLFLSPAEEDGDQNLQSGHRGGRGSEEPETSYSEGV